MTAYITAEGLRVLRELDEPAQALHRRLFVTLDEEQPKDLIELLTLARQTA